MKTLHEARPVARERSSGGVKEKLCACAVCFALLVGASAEANLF